MPQVSYRSFSFSLDRAYPTYTMDESFTRLHKPCVVSGFLSKAKNMVPIRSGDSIIFCVCIISFTAGECKICYGASISITWKKRLEGRRGKPDTLFWVFKPHGITLVLQEPLTARRSESHSTKPCQRNHQVKSTSLWCPSFVPLTPY